MLKSRLFPRGSRPLQTAATAAAALALIACADIASAQVTITNVHDAAFAGPGGSCFAACYVPGADKFIVSFGGNVVKIISADGLATDSGSLDLTGTNPSGLGFFALCAGSDGTIYGYEDNASNLWRWSSTAAVPTLAASGVAFSRSGHVIGTGTSTKVVLTGSADDGPVQIWGTADGTNFTLEDTIPATLPGAKSGFAINSTLDKIWAVGDTSDPITKGVKSGTWSVDGVFVSPNGALDTCGPMAYDNTNAVLFAFPVTGANTLLAINPDTGTVLGTSAATTTTINATAGYCGAYVSSASGSGTVWTAGRQTTATSAFLAKFTYTSTPSAVNDWLLY